MPSIEEEPILVISRFKVPISLNKRTFNLLSDSGRKYGRGNARIKSNFHVDDDSYTPSYIINVVVVVGVGGYYFFLFELQG